MHRFLSASAILLSAAVAFLINGLSTFEGGPHGGARPVPEEAVPVWRTAELHWLVRFAVGYLYPAICPLAAMTACPTVIDRARAEDAEAEARLCMEGVRDAAEGPDRLYDWKSPFDHESVSIERPAGGDPLRVTLVRTKGSRGSGDGATPAPLVLIIHGGGFTVRTGREFVATRLIRALLGIDGADPGPPALSGATWAIVEYRLAPEHPYPAATEDCLLALHHLVRERGLGAGGVHIQGLSAGATLAMETTLKSMVLVDTFFVDQPVVPLARDGGKAWSMDSPSVRRNAYTRDPPVTWLDWSLKAYTGMETLPEKERDIPVGSIATSVDITGGAMTASEWARRSSPSRPLPRLLLVTARGDPLHDGGVAFRGVYEQVIEATAQANGESRASTAGAGPEVKYFDTTSGHGGYLLFEPALFQRIMEEWYSEIRSVWERKAGYASEA